MRGFLVAVTAAVLVATTPAHAGLNFDFSFTNITGAVPGTVTGEVFGLTDNSTSAATDVVIDSYPAGLVLPTAPWDIFNAGGFTASVNSFTVAGGAITAADFVDFSGLIHLELNGRGVSDSLQDGTPSGGNVVNDNGFAAITFTADTSSPSVPEPASMALLLSGLFGLRLIRRPRRQGFRPANAARGVSG